MFELLVFALATLATIGIGWLIADWDRERRERPRF